MPKVLLVYPRPAEIMDSTLAPLGTQYLASYLLANNIETKIVDLLFTSWDEYEENIRAMKPDFIGISIQTPLLNYAKRAIEIAKKASPESKIIVGGAHPTVASNSMISDKGIDFIVIGEGEKTILDIVNKKINDRVVQGRTIENMDDLPFPRRDIIDYKKYLDKNHAMEIMVSRGCPFNCLFCQPTQRKLFGDKVKIRSPKNVADEIKEIIEKYGKNFIFFFLDDTFTWNRQWLYEFCSLVKPLKIGWNCNTRVNLVDKENLKIMRDAGCIAIAFGIESCSQKILDFLRKGTTVEQIKSAVRLTHEAGILVHADMIVGTPTETHGDLEETAKIIREIHPDSIQVTTLTPLIGTDLEKYCIDNDLLNIEKSSDYHYSITDYPIKLEHLSKEDLIFYKEKILEACRSSRGKNYWKYVKFMLTRPKYFALYLKIFLRRRKEKRD